MYDPSSERHRQRVGKYDESEEQVSSTQNIQLGECSECGNQIEWSKDDHSKVWCRKCFESERRSVKLRIKLHRIVSPICDPIWSFASWGEQGFIKFFVWFLSTYAPPVLLMYFTDKYDFSPLELSFSAPVNLLVQVVFFFFLLGWPLLQFYIRDRYTPFALRQE